MTLHCWSHWFWITWFSITVISTHPLSSFDTISTSLKSTASLKTAALVQTDNSFLKSSSNQNKLDEVQPHSIVTSFEADTDDVFDGGGILNGHGFDDFQANLLSKQISANSNSNSNIEKPTTPVFPTSTIKLKKFENVSAEMLSVITLNNVKNSTNATSINSTTIQATPTSVVPIENVTQSNLINSTVSSSQTTKLKKLDDLDIELINEDLSVNSEPPKENENSNTTRDFSDLNPNLDLNKTSEEILSTDDFNVTELAQLSERKSKGLTSEYNEVKSINTINSRSTIQISHENDNKLSSEALFVTDEDNGGVMNAGAITGICIAVLALLSMLSVMSVYIYRRRYLNKPQTLGEQDSSGYIDDSTIRDNSDEMYSLDNDSFLNSLEAMTIQNYWTDSVKHTKL